MVLSPLSASAALAASLRLCTDRNRTWGHNEINGNSASTTLFRYECGDRRLLLLPTVLSLPCEKAGTEAQNSDLKQTRASVDRFTA